MLQFDIEKRKPVIGVSQLKIEALDAQSVKCLGTCIEGFKEYMDVKCTSVRSAGTWYVDQRSLHMASLGQLLCCILTELSLHLPVIIWIIMI